MRRLSLVLVAGVVAVLAMAGCSGGGRSAASLGAAPGAGVSDLNPRPRDQVRDGGELRWPLDTMPANFNAHQFDGATQQTHAVVDALMPRLFTGAADGGLTRNNDYLTSADASATDPGTVTYWINPEAVWSDGRPITWRDFEAQWKALSGADPAYQVASTAGYDQITSVRPGTDNHQVVITFNGAYPEWRGLFSPLYPASTNTDPSVFNSGWVNRLPTTAGPFELDSLDPTGGTITLSRSPRWWGAPAKLDQIRYTVVDPAALPGALTEDKLDFCEIGSSVDLLNRAESAPGMTIRQSPDRRYSQVTFNGEPGALLADVALRQAIAKGIDRRAIAQRMVGQIVPNAATVDNHVYPVGSRDYRDNSASVAFNAVAAGQELDRLGWVRQSPTAVRSRAGQPLRLRLLEGTPDPVTGQVDRAVQDQLGQLGVQVVPQPEPLPQAGEAYRRGDFDLATVDGRSSAAPLTAGQASYATPGPDGTRRNYGRITDPNVDSLLREGLAEPREHKRAEIGNRIDRLLWQDVYTVPLYPSTGAYAVRANLANFGAPGYADVDYIDAGYLK